MPPFVKTKVLCIELNKVFPSVIDASRELYIDRRCIFNVLRGKRKTAGGYKFKRITEGEN